MVLPLPLWISFFTNYIISKQLIKNILFGNKCTRKVKTIYIFQCLDQFQCFNSYSSTAFMPSVLNNEMSEIRVGPWGVYELSELFKTESTATKQVSSGHTEKATVKVMAFPCGDGIPSPFPERMWKSKWLVETLFSKNHTDRAPYAPLVFAPS